jgi:glycosyltransferase involved in cell wall biosynthesis
VRAAVKVLVIAAAFPPMHSGEADHALQLCRRLAEHGEDVHVLTTRGNAAAGEPFAVHPIMRDWSWSDLFRLVSFLRRAGPDAVLLMYIGWIYNEHPMITFAATLAKAVRPRAAFVTLFENVEGARPDGTSLPGRILRKGLALLWGRRRVDYSFGTLLHDSDRLIAMSDPHRAQLEALSAGVSKKTELIPAPPLMTIDATQEGALRARGRATLAVTPDECVLVYLGRIYPAKGIETLLQAVQRVVGHGRRVRLVLVGGHIDRQNEEFTEAFGRDIARLPRELGIADRVTWTGEYAPDSDVPSTYLWASDICVLPFNIGVLLNNSSFAAAASHGVPIVTTRGKVLEPPFRHRDNVYLCAPKDPDELAAAIEALMDDPALRQRLACGARALAQEWFSWDQVVKRTVDTLAPRLS